MYDLLAKLHRHSRTTKSACTKLSLPELEETLLGGYSLIKMTGCSSYLSGGKICELALPRVLKPEMTVARVDAVSFRGLKGHRSEKNDENRNHIVTHSKNVYFLFF